MYFESVDVKFVIAEHVLCISMCFCLHVDENMPINLKVAITKSNYLPPARVRLGLACKENGPEAKLASDKNRRLSPGGHIQGTVSRGVCLLSSLSLIQSYIYMLPRWLSGEQSACQCRRYGFMSKEDPLKGEIL